MIIAKQNSYAAIPMCSMRRPDTSNLQRRPEAHLRWQPVVVVVGGKEREHERVRSDPDPIKIYVCVGPHIPKAGVILTSCSTGVRHLPTTLACFPIIRVCTEAHRAKHNGALRYRESRVPALLTSATRRSAAFRMRRIWWHNAGHSICLAPGSGLW